MKKLTILLFMVSSAAAQAQGTIDPERRAIFEDIIAEHGCRINNAAPAQSLMDAIAQSGFSKEDMYLYGSDFTATGDAVDEDGWFVLKTGKCS